jgi:hypothetical protein
MKASVSRGLTLAAAVAAAAVFWTGVAVADNVPSQASALTFWDKFNLWDILRRGGGANAEGHREKPHTQDHLNGKADA